MNTDANDGLFGRPVVGGWRHADLVIFFAALYAVFFTPIERETKTLALVLAGGVGLSRTIAWHALPFIRQRWLHGPVDVIYLGVYLVSFPVTCLVGYMLVAIARRFAE